MANKTGTASSDSAVDTSSETSNQPEPTVELTPTQDPPSKADEGQPTPPGPMAAEPPTAASSVRASATASVPEAATTADDSVAGAETSGGSANSRPSPVTDSAAADPQPAGAPHRAGTQTTEGWDRPGDWQVESSDQLHPYAEHQDVPATQFDGSDEYDDDYIDEYDDGALFATILSAPSLALAAFVFALTGLLGGMIPESLPYLVQIDPGTGPAYHVRIIGLIALGFAIVAASLGLAAMLRSIGSPLRWPRYLGGAAVLLALLIALQSVLLIVLAGIAPEQGGMN